MRALRWIRALRSLGLLLLIAVVPIGIALLATGGDDTVGTTTTPEPAEVLVRSFDGTGSTSTGVFVVSPGWVLKWQLDGLASDSIRIVVREAGGQEFETAVQEGLGTGERTFEDGGAFRLVVTSTGDWSIRVLQTSQSIDP